MSMDREDLEIKVSEVTGMGKGVFAKRLVKRGERIVEFVGNVIPFEEAAKKQNERAGDALQIEKRWYINSQEPAVLFNHSCNPNAGIRDDRFLTAIKDIFSGEEICYDYSTTMDEDFWTLSCRCGSGACRGLVTDFRHLPEEVRNMYLDLGVVQRFIKRQFCP